MLSPQSQSVASGVQPSPREGTKASGSSSSYHAPTAAEYAILKVELEQRRAEAEAKKRAVGKLEAENLALIREAEAARKRDDERRDELLMRHAQELQTERKMSEALQRELTEANAERSALNDRLLSLQRENVDLRRVEAKLAETEDLLVERSRRLEQLLVEKKRLDEALFHARSSDTTKVLEGRVEALQDVIADRDRVIQDDTGRLAACEAQVRELRESLAAAERAKEDVERDLGSSRVQLVQREAAITKLRAQVDDALARLAASEASARSVFDSSSEQQHSVAMLVDELRDEVRHQQRLVQATELQLAERESEAQLLRADAGNHEARLRQLRSEVALMEERLRKAHARAEEEAAQSGKEKTLLFELRSELATRNASIDVLREEIESLSASNNCLREEIADLRGLVSRSEGVEDKLRVIEQLRARQADEAAAAARAIAELKAQLAEAETAAQRTAALRRELDDAAAQVRVKDEAVNMMLEEKAVNAAHFERVREELIVEKGRTRVLQAQLAAEADRRADLERKTAALEATVQVSQTTHGKFLALQNFVQTTTSDSAKAMELNTALLDEVRGLEGRCVTLQRQLEQVIEERRVAETRAEEGAATAQEAALLRERATAQASQIAALKEKLLHAETRAADADTATLRAADASATLQQRTEDLLLVKQQLSAAREGLSTAQLQLETTRRAVEDEQRRVAREVEGRARDREEAKAQALREEMRYAELLQQLTKTHATVSRTERAQAAASSSAAESEATIDLLQREVDALRAALTREEAVRAELLKAGDPSSGAPCRRRRRNSSNSSSTSPSPLRRSGQPESATKATASLGPHHELRHANARLAVENAELRRALLEGERQQRRSSSPSMMASGPANGATEAAARELEDLRAQLMDRVEEVALLNHQLEAERRTSQSLRRQLDELGRRGQQEHQPDAQSDELRRWTEECETLQQANAALERQRLQQEQRLDALSDELRRAVDELRQLQRQSPTTTRAKKSLRASSGAARSPAAAAARSSEVGSFSSPRRDGAAVPSAPPPTPASALRRAAATSSSLVSLSPGPSMRGKGSVPPAAQRGSARRSSGGAAPSSAALPAATRAADAKALAFMANAERSAAGPPSPPRDTRSRLREAFAAAHFASPPHFSAASAPSPHRARSTSSDVPRDVRRVVVYSPPRPSPLN